MLPAAANGIITAYTLETTYPNGTVLTQRLGLVLSFLTTSLSPAQTYRFRLYASTLGGTSEASDSLNVTTLDAGMLLKEKRFRWSG